MPQLAESLPGGLGPARIQNFRGGVEIGPSLLAQREGTLAAGRLIAWRAAVQSDEVVGWGESIYSEEVPGNLTVWVVEYDEVKKAQTRAEWNLEDLE